MGGFIQPARVDRPRRRSDDPSLRLLRRRSPGSQGFIAMVMLVLLTLILGSLTIVARTSSGRVASAAQGRNREARDVAEAGLTEITSELNKEPNRKILVAGVALASWSQGTADLNNPLVNPCTRYDSNGAAATVTTPTAKAVNFKNGWQNLVAGDSTRSYRLVSVTTTDAARTTLASPPPADVITGQVKTLVRLTVEGRVSTASGTVISTSRVIKEFEVVPKCCKRSFGRNSNAATLYGEDNRFCYSGGGITADGEAVAGVIGGLNGGAITSSANTLNIVNQNLVPVTRVLCRNPVPSPGVTNPACSAGQMKLGTLSVVPSSFNIPLPPWPGDDSVGFTSLSGGSRPYIRVNGSVVQTCSVSGSPGTLSNCTTLPTCVSVSGQTGYVNGYYCRLDTIDVRNSTMWIDTSNGPITLYFDKPSSPASSSRGYISYNGNGLLLHVRCSPGAGSSGCSTVAGIADAERLNLYAYGAGMFDLRGNAGAVTMNVFAPNGSFSIKGGGGTAYNFIGRLWLNNIYANGSTSMQVMESVPTQLIAQGSCTATVCTGIGNGNNSSGAPEVDWVARSVTYSSAF